MYAIEVDKLTKVFGKGLVAVNGISFKVEEGEIFGLLGPNGAGKTTTIRMIITLTRPTSGSISLLGIDAVRKPAEIRQKNRIRSPSCVGGRGPNRVRKSTHLFQTLPRRAGHPQGPDRGSTRVHGFERTGERSRETFFRWNDAATGNRAVPGQSAQGPLPGRAKHRPRSQFEKAGLELYQEPESGIWCHHFLTTHDMLEADELCDRIAIMNRGNIAILGSPSD